VTTAPDERYHQRLADTSFRPVFILGFPRSGTTILYRILDKTGRFNVVSLYHVLYHDRLLDQHLNNEAAAAVQRIADYFDRYDLDTREADRLTVGPHQPVEYSFMLPERGFPWTVSEKNSDRLRLLCKKIIYLEGNDLPVLLKNPLDFGNFLRIKQLFPDARFIFIHRHPVDVLNSQVRAMRQIFRQKNHYLALLYGTYGEAYDNPLTRGLFRLMFSSYVPVGLLYLIHRMARDSRYYVDHVGQLAEEDYVSVTYEELCRQPSETIDSVLAHLGIDVSFDAERYIQPRDTDTAPRIETLDGYIYRRTARYCRLHGYRP